MYIYVVESFNGISLQLHSATYCCLEAKRNIQQLVRNKHRNANTRELAYRVIKRAETISAEQEQEYLTAELPNRGVT